MTRGELKVLGNYEYDSLNNLYRFKSGDTLRVYYTGHGGTLPYFEEYYYNGIYIGGTIVDTIKVAEVCTVKIVYGCDDGSDFIQSLHFVNNLQTGQLAQEQKDNSFKTYYNSILGQLHFSFQSEHDDSFDVIVYSSSGQKLNEYMNLKANEEHVFSVAYTGIAIIQFSAAKKQSTFTRLALL